MTQKTQKPGGAAKTSAKVPEGHAEVVFLRNHEVQDELRGTERATKFTAGEKKILPQASADHFVARSIAELV